MRQIPYRDRRDAGRRLAEDLGPWAGKLDFVVLALPRGGVPVACEVARALRAPLDVLVVRKLGVPGRDQLAMGAIASGGVRVINEDVVRAMRLYDEDIERVIEAESVELERQERLYRGGREAAELAGQAVMLVDDGLATGATMRAALHAVRLRGAIAAVVAAPVAARATRRALREEADAVICSMSPTPFVSVGRWYEDFDQVSDEEVRRILAEGC